MPLSSADIELFSLFALGAVLTLIVGFYSLLTTRNLIRVVINIEILSKGVMLLLIAAGNAVGRRPWPSRWLSR